MISFLTKKIVEYLLTFTSPSLSFPFSETAPGTAGETAPETATLGATEISAATATEGMAATAQDPETEGEAATEVR